MLETLDLSLKLSKKDLTKQQEKKMERLGELQRSFHERNVPIIVLFEGWLGSGKGEIINSLVQALDPRGFKVYPAYFPTDEEKSRPFFWRFWNKLPPKGQITIFDRSWYWQTLYHQVTEDLGKERLMSRYDDINAFERLLSDDNHVIIKFFTHISEEDFNKRRKKILKKSEGISHDRDIWEETAIYNHYFHLYEELDKKASYDRFLGLYEEMFSKTDSEYAPWMAVEATDTQYAQNKVLDYVIHILEERLTQLAHHEKLGSPKIKADKSKSSASPNFTSSILNQIDLNKTVSKSDYQKKLHSYQTKLRELQFKVLKHEIPVIALFEGWDAAGKGGNIKRATATLDPRAYYVTPVAAPGIVDKDFPYLWRFWKNMPAKGVIAIFDRSWYGRVMVERVEGFAKEDEWRRAYREINEMEDQLIHSGSVLVKFWLQIDQDEQLKRFKDRESNPLKEWKITEEDWRNRSKWNSYETAVNEMLFRTSTTKAPWTIVEANCKRYGRLKVLETLIESIEKSL